MRISVFDSVKPDISTVRDFGVPPTPDRAETRKRKHVYSDETFSVDLGHLGDPSEHAQRRTHRRYIGEARMNRDDMLRCMPAAAAELRDISEADADRVTLLGRLSLLPTDLLRRIDHIYHVLITEPPATVRFNESKYVEQLAKSAAALPLDAPEAGFARIARLAGRLSGEGNRLTVFDALVNEIGDVHPATQHAILRAMAGLFAEPGSRQLVSLALARAAAKIHIASERKAALVALCEDVVAYPDHAMATRILHSVVHAVPPTLLRESADQFRATIARLPEATLGADLLRYVDILSPPATAGRRGRNP